MLRVDNCSTAVDEIPRGVGRCSLLSLSNLLVLPFGGAEKRQWDSKRCAAFPMTIPSLFDGVSVACRRSGGGPYHLLSLGTCGTRLPGDTVPQRFLPKVRLCHRLTCVCVRALHPWAFGGCHRTRYLGTADDTATRHPRNRGRFRRVSASHTRVGPASTINDLSNQRDPPTTNLVETTRIRKWVIHVHLATEKKETV